MFFFGLGITKSLSCLVSVFTSGKVPCDLKTATSAATGKGATGTRDRIMPMMMAYCWYV